MSMLNSLVYSAAILCLLIVLVYHVRRLRLYRMAAQFPGPPALPVVGNALFFLGKTSDLLKKLLQLAELYPSPFRFWLGHRLWFGVYDAEHMKVILNSQKVLEKDQSYDFYRCFFGTGLLTAPVLKWKLHRKLIMPTFNMKVLESFIPIFAKHSQIMVHQMNSELFRGEFDIHHYVSLCTLDIICESAMGVCINAQTESDCRFVKSFKRTSELVFRRIYQIWLHSDFIFYRTEMGKDLRESIKYLFEFTDNVIQKKKVQSKKLREQDHVPEASGDDQPCMKAFLDLLMELSHDGVVFTDQEIRDEIITMTAGTMLHFRCDGVVFTDQEIRDEIITMTAGGSDTSAAVLSFVFLMLAMHQDVQEKAYAELCEIYGRDISGDPLITNEDLHRMEYLERVIKETLRLFPAGPIIARRVTEDLKIGDRTFPKGCSVGLAIFQVHRNDQYWPDPMKFDPDRFLPEETAKRHAYCYVPFSGGSRNCVGLRYALMSMKAVVAAVLRRYIIKKDDILLIEDIQVTQEIVIKPVDPIMLRIESRSSKTFSL